MFGCEIYWKLLLPLSSTEEVLVILQYAPLFLIPCSWDGTADFSCSAHCPVLIWCAVFQVQCPLSWLGGGGGGGGGILLYKAMNLHLHSPSYSFCSSWDTHLKLQGISHFCSFSELGPDTWTGTTSPQDFSHSGTISSIKNKLKTFLFFQYFN